MAAAGGVESVESTASRGWSSIGPAPGAIAAPVVANAASRTIYLGAISGPLLKSTDDGASFARVESWPDVGSISIAMDPRDSNVVYAGQFKTTDGGETWIDMGVPLGLCTVIDPANSNVLYSSFSGVAKSVDGGLTWEDASAGLGSALIFSMSIDPFHPEVLLAASNGEGIFRSTDAGATWSPIDAVGTTVWTILFDPHDEGVVWAGSDGDGVYKSIDGGSTFARVGSPEVGVVISLAKSGGRLFAGTGTYGVSVSDDGGATWTNAHVTPAKSLILSVDEEGGVYLGTHFDGAYRLPAENAHDTILQGDARVTAEDYARHGGWRRIGWDLLRSFPGQDGHALAIDPSDHRHLYFTTNDGGLHETDDGGRTWKDGGVDGFTQRSARAVEFDPQQPRRIYATSFVGGGLFRSKDRGRHWERRLFGSETTYSTGMAVDPVDHTVYIATLATGIALLPNGLWKTSDFGETFTRIDRAPGAGPDEFLDFNGRGVTLDPRHRNVLFFGDKFTGIWRSKDFGKSWINVFPDVQAFFITVDPTDSRILYCGTVGLGVLKSTDGGTTWAQKSAGLPRDDPADPASYWRTTRAAGVQVNPQNHRVLYVAIEGGGVFKSRNGGETWSEANLGLDQLDVRGLLLDPVSPNVLYLSTFTSVYKTTSGGE
jgi:photosystem II stability/assembly factor-like uncharacterized protein